MFFPRDSAVYQALLKYAHGKQRYKPGGQNLVASKQLAKPEDVKVGALFEVLVDSTPEKPAIVKIDEINAETGTVRLSRDGKPVQPVPLVWLLVGDEENKLGYRPYKG